MEFRQLQNQSELNKTCILLSNHCNNNPAIRETVRQFIDQKNITSAIQSLWSSIYYFRKNLVFGPDATHRGDDPKLNGFDQSLFSQQSNNYQSQMQLCRSQFFNKNWNNALDMFLKLKPTSNVLWTFDKKLGKWFVAGSSKLPGNVGFDY